MEENIISFKSQKWDKMMIAWLKFIPCYNQYLWDNANILSQRFQLHIFDVIAWDKHSTIIWVVESVQKSNDGRFPDQKAKVNIDYNNMKKCKKKFAQVASLDEMGRGGMRGCRGA